MKVQKTSGTWAGGSWHLDAWKDQGRKHRNQCAWFLSLPAPPPPPSIRHHAGLTTHLRQRHWIVLTLLAKKLHYMSSLKLLQKSLIVNRSSSNKMRASVREKQRTFLWHTAARAEWILILPRSADDVIHGGSLLTIALERFPPGLHHHHFLKVVFMSNIEHCEHMTVLF